MARMTRSSKSEPVIAKQPDTAEIKAEGAETKAEIGSSRASVSKRKKTTELVKQEQEEDGGSLAEEEDERPAKKRKAKAAKAAKAVAGDGDMPLAERTVACSLKKAMYIGAHVSGAGGAHKAVTNAVHIGANAFALFLKSQRKWTNPPLADEVRDQFRLACSEHGFDARSHVLPHGSYLVNLAQTEQKKAEQAYSNFLDDAQRCDALGIKLYNFHPGSAGDGTMESACARISAQLNKAHEATESVITLIENMCGHGKTIGGRFEELRDIIDGVQDKSRVGVCLDTCHAFAAGYDLRTPDAYVETMKKFDEIVGLKYIKAFHLNDSKAPIGSHRDLHANIGTGFLGLRAFHNVVNDERFQGLPMLLETPIEVKDADGKTTEDKQIWADEIKLLESLIDMDPATTEFAAECERLQAKGADERQRVQEQVDKKAEADAKKAGKLPKGQKKIRTFMSNGRKGK